MSMDVLHLTIKTPRLFEMSVISHPVTYRHSPGDLSPVTQLCESQIWQFYFVWHNYVLRVNESTENYHCNINPLNAELNPICYLLALLTHHFLHVSRIRVK